MTAKVFDRLLYVAHCLTLAALVSIASVSVAYSETRDFSGGLTLQKYGNGEMRRFGFLIYEAQLWAAASPTDPPMALQLTYKRDIPGAKIVDASLDQMRALGANDQQLTYWAGAMSRIFPDVKSGDQITGIYRPGSVTFLYNNREVGFIRDPDFARLFFGIWLDPRTSEPRLRSRLLQPSSG